MSVSIGTLIGQILVLLIVLPLAVIGVRFLIAATRLMNRQADALEREHRHSNNDGAQ